MRALTILDLTMYFLAGVLAVLYIRSLSCSSEKDEPDKAKDTPGTRAQGAVMAITVGLTLSGARYMATCLAKSNAMQKLTDSLAQPTENMIVA